MVATKRAELEGDIVQQAVAYARIRDSYSDGAQRGGRGDGKGGKGKGSKGGKGKGKGRGKGKGLTDASQRHSQNGGDRDGWPGRGVTHTERFKERRHTIGTRLDSRCTSCGYWGHSNSSYYQCPHYEGVPSDVASQASTAPSAGESSNPSHFGKGSKGKGKGKGSGKGKGKGADARPFVGLGAAASDGDWDCVNEANLERPDSASLNIQPQSTGERLYWCVDDYYTATQIAEYFSAQ